MILNLVLALVGATIIGATCYTWRILAQHLHYQPAWARAMASAMIGLIWPVVLFVALRRTIRSARSADK